MKNLNSWAWCLIVNFTLNSNSFSQTYIAPMVGYDFQQVISDPIFRLFLNNKGFGNSSPLIGINLKQRIFYKFYLQLGCDFTHKHVAGLPDGSVGQELVYHYNYLKNQFLITYYWKNKWKFGGGVTYNIVNNLYEEYIDIDLKSDPINSYYEMGWVYFLGLRYNDLEFEVYYYSRLGIPKEGDTRSFYHLHQIQSLGLRVSYNFKIFDGCKKKDLPELQPGNKMANVE